MRSVQTAAHVQKLAQDIGIQHTFVVLNKIRDQHDRDLLQCALDEQAILGELPYCAQLVRADLEGSPLDINGVSLAPAIDRLVENLEKELGQQRAMAT